MGSEIDYDYELGNGWGRYQIMVLKELKRLADGQDKMTLEIQALKTWQAVEEAVGDDREDATARRNGSRLAWAALLIPSLVALATSIATLAYLIF